MRIQFLLFAALTASSLSGVGQASTCTSDRGGQQQLIVSTGNSWMINKDVEQLHSTPQSNFEIILEGDARTGMGAGFDSVTNPFATPQRTQSFDGSNTTVTWSGSNTIAQRAGVKRHFGVSGPGKNPPKVLDEFWTPLGNSTIGRVPGISSDVNYPVGIGSSSGLFSNDTLDEITILQAGFRVVNRDTVQIGDLNAANMPPGTFLPIHIADPILSAGESTPLFSLTVVDPDVDAIVLFVETQFSGISSGNFYDGNVREWIGSNTNAPSSLTAFCIPGVDGVIPCPCSNPRAGGGLGCDNFGAGPSQSGTLDANGIASLAGDTIVLNAHGLNNSSLTVFFTGNTQLLSGLTLGAGVRCVRGSLGRLYTAGASGGAVSRPGVGDPSVSVRSAALGSQIFAGDTRYYFNVYRDPAAAGPCGNIASTVNTTNAGSITWSL